MTPRSLKSCRQINRTRQWSLASFVTELECMTAAYRSAAATVAVARTQAAAASALRTVERQALGLSFAVYFLLLSYICRALKTGTDPDAELSGVARELTRRADKGRRTQLELCHLR